MAFRDLRGRDRERAEVALAWASGRRSLEGFPLARSLCAWLVDVVVEGGGPGGDVERGWQACCELVQIAAGLLEARPDPRPGRSLYSHPLVLMAVSELDLRLA